MLLANATCEILFDLRYDVRCFMPSNMPDRNITVKNEYSTQSVEARGWIGHYRGMKNMATIREAKGLTQEQLADMTGLGQGYLSKIEAGTANPTLEKILVIAKALRVDPAQLFALPDLQSRVLAAISAIDDPVQVEAALVVLEAMAEGRR
jgi:transcriptional regulator with XRE-family HTH domain